MRFAKAHAKRSARSITEKQTAYAKVRSVGSMTQVLQTLERPIVELDALVGESDARLQREQQQARLVAPSADARAGMFEIYATATSIR